MENTTSTLILKLANGQTIVSDVEEGQGVFICTNIMELVESYDDGGQLRMGMTKFMPYAADDAPVSVPVIMAIIAIPGPELAAAHKRAFSKIITPETAGIILPQ